MKKVLIWLVIFFVLGGVYFISAISSSNKTSEATYFTILSGQSLGIVTENLKEQELIKNKLVFKVYATLTKRQSKLLAGIHYISEGMNIKEILEILTTGGSVDNEIDITIIEGWHISEIAEHLDKLGIVGRDDFVLQARLSSWQSEYDFLDSVDTQDIEGFLFPDTYRIFNDATAEDIVRKMLDNFDSKLTDSIRSEIKNQGKTIFEVVTLASVVEREVPGSDDKKMIADVFLKRLKDGIALQSDATVNYVTGGDRPQPTYADLAIESPYNTYKHRGLTPGPISNPGIDSIVAVVYPTSNPYYYFLTTLDDGEVIYGRTYDEHLSNKAKYLD
jgi:UPF0755 protein